MSDPLHSSLPLRDMTRLVQGAKALRVGDPVSERTLMGPLVSNAHRERVERYVVRGLADGDRRREKGRLGILEYMEQKSFYWGMNVALLPWAA